MLNKVLISQLKKNDGLILELVNNINENDLHTANFGSNSILFILGHILYSRFYMLNALGNLETGKLEQFFKYPANFDAAKKYPSFIYIESELNICTAKLYKEICLLNDEQLTFIREDKSLLKEDSFFSFISSIIRHETFHLGQIQMLKKNLNLKVSKFLF